MTYDHILHMLSVIPTIHHALGLASIDHDNGDTRAAKHIEDAMDISNLLSMDPVFMPWL